MGVEIEGAMQQAPHPGRHPGPHQAALSPIDSIDRLWWRGPTRRRL